MTDLDELSKQIEEIWAQPDYGLDPAAVRIVESVIDRVDDGRLRCAQLADDGWQVNLWVKKAIALYFRIGQVKSTNVGPFEFRDRFPLKEGAEKGDFRIVPPGAARRGCHIGPGSTLMPGYLNLARNLRPGREPRDDPSVHQRHRIALPHRCIPGDHRG